MAPKSVQIAPEGASRRSQARRPRDALGRPADALAPARRRQPPVQGTRPGRRLDCGHRGRRGRLSEPDHLLLPHQGSAVRRSRLPRHALCGARGRTGGIAGPRHRGNTPARWSRRVTATDSVAFFTEALTLTRRRQDLAPLVERTDRAAARRGHARLCRPDRTARLEHACAIPI